jgi:hypothetical protein
MNIIASTTFFKDVNIVGVIVAPNLAPIFQHPFKTPEDSTEPIFSFVNCYSTKILIDLS